MKIGLLTYFWENNAGQYWQVRTTFTCLKRRFPNADIELINIRHWRNAYEGRLPRRDLLKPWRILRVRRFAAAYEAGRNRCLKFSHSSCLTDNYEEANQFINSLDFDLLIVGADVVLKPLPDNRVKGGVPVYWLSPNIKTRKAILGSSADITRFSNIDNNVADKMRRSLKGYDFIAVRDRMTQKLMQELGTAKVPVWTISDPTFTLDPSDAWKEDARRLFPKRKSKRKLAAVHLPKSESAPLIVASLKHMGFEVLSTTREIRGTRWCGALTPTAWAGMSCVVDIVVTVSFHESIFALKQGRPVLAVDMMSNRFDPETYLSKTLCLMEDFGLVQTHHINLVSAKDGHSEFCKKIDSALHIPLRETLAICNRFKADYLHKLDDLAALFDL